MLSVITPARNMARFLPDTLDSVAALSAPHQHIVVDGDSDDGTVELLEGREDPRLTWISEPDSGQTEAVNKGLRLARGDLLAWINADDAYIPDAVDRAIDHLARNPQTGAIFGGVNYVDEHGEVFRTLVPPRFSWRRYLYFGAFVTTPTIIWRRELLAQVPSLNQAYVDAADYDFFLRLLRGVASRPDRPSHCSTSATTRPARRPPTSGSNSTRRCRSDSAGHATRCSEGSCDLGRASDVRFCRGSPPGPTRSRAGSCRCFVESAREASRQAATECRHV